MGADDTKSKPALGFLTVLEHPQHGLFGGYLLLNMAGRPMEFHCTAPIKPNRAQQILYGPTLQAFLYGEQIGHTLLEKAKIVPSFICTDREPVLTVREYVSLPVVLVLPPDGPAADQGTEYVRIDAAHPGGYSRREPLPDAHCLVDFELGQNRLALPERSGDDRRLITERFAGVAGSFDLAEPFTRIREAIEEAQQAVRSP